MFKIKLTAPVQLGILLFLLASLPRVALLLTSERYPDADECIVGIMAIDIAKGAPPPLFFYGQHYGGGHVIEALGAGLFFRFAHVSQVALQAVPVLFSVGLVFLVFAWLGRILGHGAAFFCAAALSFSTPFLKSSFKADGYVETIFLGVAALFLYDGLASRECGEKKSRGLTGAALTGFLLGMAWWSYDFGLLYLATILVAAAAGRRWEMARPGILLLFAAGFLLGASLLIYDNITTGFANIRHLVLGPARESPRMFESLAYGWWRLISHDFAAFLTKDSIHRFAEAVPPEAWVYAALAVLGFGASIVFRRRLGLPAVLYAAPCLYLVFYLLSSFAGTSPRYLLPLEPFISIHIVCAILFLWRGGPRLRAPAVLAAAVFAAVLAIGLVRIVSDDSIVEGPVVTPPRAVSEVISILRNNNVDCVYTTYFIKWRILFETREAINAYDVLSHRAAENYNKYEEIGCDASDPPAFVFSRRSNLFPPVVFRLVKEKIPFKQFFTGSHVVIIARQAGGDLKDGRHETGGKILK